MSRFQLSMLTIALCFIAAVDSALILYPRQSNWHDGRHEDGLTPLRLPQALLKSFASDGGEENLNLKRSLPISSSRKLLSPEIDPLPASDESTETEIYETSEPATTETDTESTSDEVFTHTTKILTTLPQGRPTSQPVKEGDTTPPKIFPPTPSQLSEETSELDSSEKTSEETSENTTELATTEEPDTSGVP